MNQKIKCSRVCCLLWLFFKAFKFRFGPPVYQELFFCSMVVFMASGWSAALLSAVGLADAQEIAWLDFDSRYG